MAKIREIGFPCVTGDGSLSTCHRFKLSSLSEEKLFATVNRNLDDMEMILNRMSKGPLRLFRIGSDLVPFASHREMAWDWRNMISERLSSIGSKFPRFRFSLHPGQYNVLNSPDEGVYRNCVAELEYSVEVLDFISPDPMHKVVLHGGGIYGDREQSTTRLIRRVAGLSASFKKRLVLENDERFFNMAQITAVCEESGVPPVFDLHHHDINPCDDIEGVLRRAERLWDSVPKVHLSSQKPGARVGAHDDMLHHDDLLRLTETLPFSADLMVEAKLKDIAALDAHCILGEKGLLFRTVLA